jgi:hypothetical protein
MNELTTSTNVSIIPAGTTTHITEIEQLVLPNNSDPSRASGNVFWTQNAFTTDQTHKDAIIPTTMAVQDIQFPRLHTSIAQTVSGYPNTR